jgi:bifunctional N-acetylglucosamine-1-phosphate-uridyltransferase/glucosamine-1-phosphate-acetyltransferase GlmU-like protein
MVNFVHTIGYMGHCEYNKYTNMNDGVIRFAYNGKIKIDACLPKKLIPGSPKQRGKHP